MNERIKELMIQCEKKYCQDHDDYFYDMEKFAELIVRECVSIVEAQKESLCDDDSDWSDYDFGYHDAVIDSVDMIKQKLGVEE